MSIEKTHLWLQQHSDALLAFEHNIRFFTPEDESATPPKLADFISQDPALSLALLKKVNANRAPESGKDIVCSAQAAISLLGERVARELLQSMPVAESELTQQDQLFLYSQICNRSLHTQQQMVHWAKHIGYHQTDEFRLPALLYFTGEALCCCHDFKNYLKYIEAGNADGSETEFFGFSFAQLSEALCGQVNLPILITQAQQLESSKSQQAKMLFHIATICHFTEQGWYHSSIEQAFNQLAETLQLPVERVITRFHQNSVDCSRESLLHLAWQAGARLPLISDSAWTPAKAPASANQNTRTTTAAQQNNPREAIVSETKKEAPQQPNSEKHSITPAIERIKRTLASKEATQSQVLHDCIEGLSKELKFNRVGLFLLSRDKTTLQNRMAAGMEKDSPLRQLQLPVAQSGLFKILLKKPQAIHIFPGNYKKYAALIPTRLQACNQTQEFMAMSLFIGDKPVAIIYADHKGRSAAFEAADFKHFKQMVSFCSKALAFLQKKPA